MRTSHEEADVIIPQQVSMVTAAGSTCLKVVCENVDVFVLLCHFYLEENWTHDLFMECFAADKSLVCVKSSVKRHQGIVPYILSAHAFVCDSVPSMFGVGKKTVIKALQKTPLICLGEEDAAEDAACYSGNNESSSQNRAVIWKKRTDSAKLTAKPVQLKSLPPTDPVLELNIKRARFQ